MNPAIFLIFIGALALAGLLWFVWQRKHAKPQVQHIEKELPLGAERANRVAEYADKVIVGGVVVNKREPSK